MPPKKRSKKMAKFLKRDKLSMIEEPRKEKCSDIIEKCVTVVRERVHLILTEGLSRNCRDSFL